MGEAARKQAATRPLPAARDCDCPALVTVCEHHDARSCPRRRMSATEYAACVFVREMAAHIDGAERGSRKTEKRVADVVREEFFAGRHDL